MGENQKQSMDIYETVIGLEVHVELSTSAKIFCGCSTEFGGEPNSHTCPVCSGMPGTLPVLNRQVLEYAVRVGLATHCTVSRHSHFDRKNYFYPDNPQNYQISQLYEPICQNGYVEITTENGSKKIRIHELHMEEDAGKLIHDNEGNTLVDLNRAGVPLIEIVSEPDLSDGEEVVAYLEKLRQIILYLGVSDCKLQEGSMRADVNLSVRKKGEELGTRTEMKNLSSFHNIRRMIEHERKRQIALLESGQSVEMETRRWDEEKGESFCMRSKEEAKDYRYFPDPDLPRIDLPAEWITAWERTQPELPDEKVQRYLLTYDIPEYDIRIITGTRQMAELFEEASRLCGQPKKVSNWLMGETLRLMRERGADERALCFDAKHLADLILMTERGEISQTVAKEVFEKIFTDNVEPKRYVQEQGLGTTWDEDLLQQACREAIKDNPQSAQDYRNGKEKAIGFLVGQTMKILKGQADPVRIRELLKEELTEKK